VCSTHHIFRGPPADFTQKIGICGNMCILAGGGAGGSIDSIVCIDVPVVIDTSVSGCLIALSPNHQSLEPAPNLID